MMKIFHFSSSFLLLLDSTNEEKLQTIELDDEMDGIFKGTATEAVSRRI